MQNRGINALYDAYKKNPSSVENLLSTTIEISEQLNGSRFSVQCEGAGELSYFKRDSSPITKIDRTIARYYEKAILHFETLPQEVLNKLPENWKFGFEYFPNLNPVKINYDRMPLNGLVLTDIVVKDPNGKVLEIIVDKKTLDEWADVLVVEHPPIFFEGKLKDTQRIKILDFLNTPFDDLVKRFKTENFTEFFLNLLTPQINKTFMQNDKKKDIEGLIFRFNGKNPLKLAKPDGYSEKEKKEDRKPSDIYNLTLVIMQEFFQSLDFKKIRLKEKTFEDRYIEFISKVFNVFIDSEIYKKNFAGGVDFELPTYLSREEAKGNFKFVTDQLTTQNIEKSSTNRELFKIMLASMRSHKKKAMGVFTKDLISYHNSMVDKIADYVNVGIKESVLTFEQYKRIFLNESEDVAEFGIGSKKEVLEEEFALEEVTSINEEFFPTFDEMNKLKHYTKVAVPMNVIRRSLDEEISVTEPSKKYRVCLVAGKFQPFNNGHLAMIKDAYRESGMKSFLVVKRKNLPGTITEELHRQILDEVKKEYAEFIEGYSFTEGYSANEIAKSLPEKYEVGSFTGDESECQDYAVQSKRNKLSEEFKVIVGSKYVSPSQVREKILKEDMEGYRKLVPKVLWNFFYKLRNETKK